MIKKEKFTFNAMCELNDIKIIIIIICFEKTTKTMKKKHTESHRISDWLQSGKWLTAYVSVCRNRITEWDTHLNIQKYEDYKLKICVCESEFYESEWKRRWSCFSVGIGHRRILSCLYMLPLIG